MPQVTLQSDIVNNDPLITAFLDYRTFRHALKDKSRRKALVAKLTSDETLFLHIIANSRYLLQVLRRYPKLRSRLINVIRQSNTLFNALVTSSHVFLKLTDYQNNSKKLFKRLIGKPDNLFRLFRHYHAFKKLTMKYSAYQAKLFDLLFANDYVLKKMFRGKDYLEEFINDFPAYAHVLVEIIVANPTLFDHFFKNAYELQSFAKKFAPYKTLVIHKLLAEDDLFATYVKSYVALADFISELPEFKPAFLAKVLASERLFVHVFHQRKLEQVKATGLLCSEQSLFKFISTILLPLEDEARLWHAHSIYIIPYLLKAILAEDDRRCDIAVRLFTSFIEFLNQRKQLSHDKIRYWLPLLNKAIVTAQPNSCLAYYLRQAKAVLLEKGQFNLVGTCLQHLSRQSFFSAEKIQRLPQEIKEKLNTVPATYIAP